MAANLTLTLKGRAADRISALRLDTAAIPINPDRSWSVTVPVKASVLAIVATLVDGSETTRVVQLALVPGGPV